jgi:S-DNA-T family DNA segregation ATPase FtsK/SpoIIIE
VNPSGDGETVRLRVVRRLAYNERSGPIPWRPGLHVALQDTGEDWSPSFPGQHILCVGATGAGKSGWQNVIVASSFRRPFRVVRWGFDIKQVELALWGQAFERVALDLASATQLLTDLDGEIRRRFAVLSSRGERDWSPESGLPMLLVVVDEMRELIRVAPGEKPDAGKERQARLESAAALGRAAGVVLLCCTQEPLAETVGRIRVNMGTTICGRVRTETDAVTALGNVGRFLQPERIRVPGEAWVVPTGEPFKARARWIDNDGIRWLSAQG